MTYEEILRSKGGYQNRLGKMPYGMLTRKQVGGKFRDVLVIDGQWSAITAFREGLQTDSEVNRQLVAKQQLHYELKDDGQGVFELELEPGTYQTLEQVLDANPAKVAQPGFVDGIVMGLLSMMEQMHDQKVYHLCFSPRNVLVRKGDDMPMLLLHASSFAEMRNLMRVFEGMEDYIAPEVKADGPLTAQSDIYSLGQLIVWLFQHGDMPFEYKRVAAKATRENASSRYASATKMLNQLNGFRNKKRSFYTLLAACVVALVCVGLYFELTPKAQDIEFVEAVPKGPQEDYLDDDFDPELDLLSGDSTVTDTLTEEERFSIDVYMRKAAEIYRRQFAEKAEGILSKVYNNESMNSTEKAFMAKSSAMSEELVKLQNELAEQSGISDALADSIASEVVARIIAEKERNMSLGLGGE